jgi:outer membrane protein
LIGFFAFKINELFFIESVPSHNKESLMRTLAVSLAVASLALLPLTASAESPWTVKVGVSQINPKSDNGILLVSGTPFSSEVSSEVGFTPSIEYKFSPNIVGEVLLAIPFEHEVKVTGGVLNDAKVATFKHLPPTFSAKYLFTPMRRFLLMLVSV